MHLDGRASAGRLGRLVLACVLVAGCAESVNNSPLPDSAFSIEHGGAVFETWPEVADRPYGGGGQNGMPPGFRDETLIGGLNGPTAVRILPDGRVLIAEQRGVVKLFPSVDDGSPVVLLDLRTEVYNRGQLGLLGLAVDPDFEHQPYVYVAYTRDAPLGGMPPTYGAAGADQDDCPQRSACPASARLARFRLDGNPPASAGPEQALIDDWCVSGPNHTIGTITFAADGALIAGGGDGADGDDADYGQISVPANACGDPPTAVGASPEPPSAEGGSLRSQDLLTLADPLSLDGTIIRVDRATGEGLPDNPLAGSADANARRVIGVGMRNPYRFTFRPGSDELWLADVGWDSYEEIDRVAQPLAAQPFNGGWPCYEGPRAQPAWQSMRLDLCATLYAHEDGVTFPVMSFARGPLRRSGCQSPGAAISGLAFYDGDAFPAEYDSALFFADLPRRCIYVAQAGPDGLPDPRTVRQFASRVAVVDLIAGADGALYYADYVDGALHRISWSG